MHRRAFSLLETLIAIGLISVLLSLLWPAVQAIRERAALSSCQNQMRQIGLAVMQFAGAHGRVPPASRGPEENLLWTVWVLPHLEHAEVWATAVQVLRQFPMPDVFPYQSPPHVADTVIREYACPSDARYSRPVTDPDGIRATFTSYIGIGGGRSLDGVFARFPGIRLEDIHDGLSNTAMLAERPPPDTLQAGWWYSYSRKAGVFGLLYGPDGWIRAEEYSPLGDPCVGPFHYGPGRADNPCDRHHPWSFHPTGGNIAMADGSVRFLGYSGREILILLATINGGEVLPSDW